MPLTLHVSHAECFLRCPEEYHLRYRLNAAPGGYAPHLAIGTAMHAAGAAYRQGGDESAMIAAGAAALQQEADALGATAEQAASDGVKLATMIMGYWHRWGKPAAYPDVHTNDNEVSMERPLIVNGRRLRCRIAGRLDGMVSSDGGPYLYEMKTTSDTLDETQSYLAQGLQLPVYHYLMGGEPAGTIIDIVKKPTVIKRKGETWPEWAQRALLEYKALPDYYFRRVLLPYSEAQVRWAMDIMARVAEGIRASERRGYVAARGWSCCKRAGGWCPLKALCWYGSDIKERGEGDAKEEQQGSNVNGIGNNNSGGDSGAVVVAANG